MCSLIGTERSKDELQSEYADAVYAVCKQLQGQPTADGTANASKRKNNATAVRQRRAVGAAVSADVSTK